MRRDLNGSGARTILRYESELSKTASGHVAAVEHAYHQRDRRTAAIALIIRAEGEAAIRESQLPAQVHEWETVAKAALWDAAQHLKQQAAGYQQMALEEAMAAGVEVTFLRTPREQTELILADILGQLVRTDPTT